MASYEEILESCTDRMQSSLNNFSDNLKKIRTGRANPAMLDGIMVMNGIALRDSLERNGIKTRVMSAIPMPGIVEHYDRRLAIHLLDEGFVVIFTAGTGNPFFTTDTAACLRGVEINADLMLKATKVDGVYSDDPKKNSEAKFFKSLTFDEAIHKNLKVMDTTALTLARDNNMNIKVFNYESEGALLDIVKGKDIGTLISNG